MMVSLVRHVVPIVEQMSRAAEELASDHPVHHRLGYMLVDNAAELIVHRFAANLALKAKSWLAGPLCLTPKQMRQARTGKFDDRLGVVVAAGVLSGEERRFATCARASEQPVAASDRDTAQRTLGDIVVDLQASIVEEARQCRPALGAVGDGLCHVGPG